MYTQKKLHEAKLETAIQEAETLLAQGMPRTDVVMMAENGMTELAQAAQAAREQLECLRRSGALAWPDLARPTRNTIHRLEAALQAARPAASLTL